MCFTCQSSPLNGGDGNAASMASGDTCVKPAYWLSANSSNANVFQVPSPPGDEDEDFILVHHSDVQLSEKAEAVYTQLAKILKEQHAVRHRLAVAILTTAL